jgi:hypothetical protein
MWSDPEERIIAAALDQAELDDANERGAGADRVQAGRSCKGDDHHFSRVGGAGQDARFDDWGTLRRGDPVSRPWRGRITPPTSPAVALTDLRDANGTRP